MKFSQWIAAMALLAGVATSGWAQNVTVTEGWVRVAVPGQSASGAFMKIRAKDATRLIGVSSPLAGIAEIHEMKMVDGVMKMRAADTGVEIPAGKTVELSSGGYHVMLMDLKGPLPKGSSMPLTLVFRDAKGTETRLALTLPVAVSAPKR